MKRSLFFIALIMMAFLAGTASGQNQKRGNNTVRIKCADGIETYYSKPLYFDISPPLRDLVNMPVRKGKNKERNEVPNYVNNMEGTVPANFTQDPVWQKTDATSNAPLTNGPIVNIEGIGNLDGLMPPDTQGDVGLDYYIQVINLHFAVYPKTGSGTPVLGPVLLHTLWTGIGSPWEGTDSGDPIVLYDQAAGRWLISQFSLPNYPSGPFGQLVAISTTSDPTGTWYRYVYNFNGIMPDYPKFGVWPDGYYMSMNQFYGASGPAACAWERSKMLTGDPSAGFIYKNCSSAGGVMQPSDWDGLPAPPSNSPNYFAFFTGSSLKIWSFVVDWTTPTNSTIGETSSMTPATFSSYFCSASRGRCIPQPGTSYKLETLSDRLMYRLQYRNFGSYQTMVTSHTVNVDGNGQAGCRWYELRNTGSGWTIYQQGTYAPDAPNRWMPSVAMNGSGDIGLGYSVSDATSTYPSIRYTGRRAADPLGTMTIPEQTIIAGTGSQTYSGAGRWGDYSGMAVDPTDDLTFWYTTEYVQTTGDWSWQTRIASFKFSNNPAVTTTAPSGVTTTTATLNGTINPNGLASTYHFEWGTSTSYGTNTTVTSAGSGSTTINVNVGITGLAGGTTYHFRLVGVNAEGTTNGNDMSFTPGAAVVTTTAASAITLTGATTGGNVLADGGGTVTARGICWSTTANPTTAGSHTTDGAGLGTYTSTLTGLTASTLYHIRAYATNSFGTWYGADLTFTTLCGIYSLPFSESFTNTTIPTCWSQVDHQGNGQIWQFGVITSAGHPNLTGNYAYLNSDAYGSGSSQNADLLSPVLNCTTFNNITLQFNHYFQAYSGSSGTLSYSINGGSSWTTIQTFTSSTSNPAAFNQVIAAAANQPSVQFRWNYIGSFGWWWGIDDISITGTLTNTLAVTPANQNVPQSPAGSTTFNVTSNTSWNASSNQTWCTVNPSGTGNGTITANYSINTGVGNRVATITVTATSAPTQTVTVTQAGIPATLGVTPSNQNVPYTPAGSTTFNVTSNTSWTVASDQTWCTVNPTGTGNGTITANYPVYTGTTIRVANVTVTVTGLPPVNVTVTQAASPGTLTVTPSNLNVSFMAGMVDFAVASNASWTTSSNASWCTTTPSGTGNGTMTATYTENTALSPRIATLTVTATGITPVSVTVTQDAAVPNLNVTPSNQNVPATPAGATTFNVTSNSGYTIASDQTWCTVPPAGTGNQTVSATYTENTGVSQRIANITFTVTGLPPVIVTVTQSGTTATLSVTPSNQNVPYIAGSTSFSVTSNSSWTATKDSAWLSITPSGGTGNGTITASYIQNPYHVSRVATVTVTVAGLTPQLVTVTQAQSTVSVDELTSDIIRIIPNPSNGTFRIDAGKLKFESMNVTIVDMSGRTIMQKVCWEKPDLFFNLSSSPDGSYFVKISVDNQELTRKLILTHK